MSFVERSIILCPYLRGSTIGGSTVYQYFDCCPHLYYYYTLVLITALHLRAKSVLSEVTEQVMTDFDLVSKPLELNFKGLGSFSQNVLFTQVEEGPSKDRLRDIAGKNHINYANILS